MKKSVVITGGKGFIGSHLSEHLNQVGFKVIPLGRGDVDLNDFGRLEELMNEHQPNFVIHLASATKPGRGAEYNFESFYESEVVPSVNVAKAVPKATELALFFGSCEEYGNGPVPFQESQASVCFSQYGWGKIAAHYATTLVCRERDLSWCWIRNFLTFGEGQKSQLLIPSLISKCLADQVVPLTPGEQTRDFIYVADLCRQVAAILQDPKKARGETLNLCSGIERSVRSVAEQIQKIIGKGRLGFGALSYRSNEAMRFVGSTEKFERLYGKIKLTPLETALERTIASWRD